MKCTIVFQIKLPERSPLPQPARISAMMCATNLISAPRHRGAYGIVARLRHPVPLYDIGTAACHSQTPAVVRLREIVV